LANARLVIDHEDAIGGGRLASSWRADWPARGGGSITLHNDNDKPGSRARYPGA